MSEEREWRERGETGEDSGETKEGRREMRGERGEVRGNNIDSIHHSEDVDIHTVY